MKKQELEKSTISSNMILGSSDTGTEELPIHKEIKEDLFKIFSSIDPLTNYHYTPKQVFLKTFLGGGGDCLDSWGWLLTKN